MSSSSSLLPCHFFFFYVPFLFLFRLFTLCMMSLSLTSCKSTSASNPIWPQITGNSFLSFLKILVFYISQSQETTSHTLLTLLSRLGQWLFLIHFKASVPLLLMSCHSSEGQTTPKTNSLLSIKYLAWGKSLSRQKLSKSVWEYICCLLVSWLLLSCHI